MLRKLAAALPLAAAVLASVGCASGPDLETRCEELTRENEDLQRRNSQVEGDLAACQARCSALERDASNRKNTPMKSSERTNEYQLPEDLEKSGVKMRKRGSDTVIEIPSDLFFGSGQSVLSKEGERALGSVCAMLKQQHANGLIRVEGHTDSDPIKRTKGKYHCNLDLGFERAHQVAHYLTEKGGMDERRIVCETYGDHLPADPKNKAKNRRVEIVISR